MHGHFVEHPASKKTKNKKQNPQKKNPPDEMATRTKIKTKSTAQNKNNTEI